MTSGYIKAFPPGATLPPPKYGLTADQWRVVNDLAWEYEHEGPLREFLGFANLHDAAEACATERMKFARWLRETGRINEE